MKRIRRLLGAIATAAVLLAGAGALYQARGWRADARRSPEPGRLVNGLMMNCGGAGSPTVILESGLGDGLGEWRLVQPEIAKWTRVCSYDRAGYGMSREGAMPRTSDRIAAELHAALENAGVMAPLILVGHSFGGYNVRVFARKYRDEVAGMVLVDATEEDQYALLPAAWRKIAAEQLARYEWQARWAPLWVGLGIARAEYREQLGPNAYRLLQGKYLRARASELRNIQASAEQARAAGGIGDKPLVVLTAGKNTDPIFRRELGGKDFEEFTRIWIDLLQPRLLRLSSNAERVVLQDSGHDVPADRPDAIVAAVRRVAGQAARSGLPH